MLSQRLNSGGLKLTRDFTCRLIVDHEPRDGAWNMAVDEALLESAIRDQSCTVRWYRWNPPTISIGYFQSIQPAIEPTDRQESAEPSLGVVDADADRFREIPKVRRLSGGGAILHDREWTYSVTVPPTHHLASMPDRLYLAIHETLIKWMIGLGLDARMRQAELVQSQEPFLCFSRGDPRDIVLNGHKVVGSAQRRRQGAVLQHGSLLMHRSEYTPQYPGLRDLGLSRDPTISEIESLGLTIGNILSASPRLSVLTAIEQECIQRLHDEKYREPDWNAHRVDRNRRLKG